MAIKFSAYPGCRERHLQRRQHNPLFGEAAPVTQEMVDAARREDEQEQQALREDFQQLLREAAALKPNVDNEVVLQLKERIDRVYLQCMGTGGNMFEERRGLLKLHDAVIVTLRRAASAANDARALAEIEREQEAHRMHLELLEYPVIAHLLRPECDCSIAPDELVPTLLSEDDESVRAAMTLFDGAQLDVMAQHGRALLDRLREQGHEPPVQAVARLNVIEGTARTRSNPHHHIQ